jgi:glycosyltransferase involved in cell wall biosynthesis
VTDALVSVLMPVRDGAATLDEALSGILSDGDPAIEVLAVDDGSTDGTWRRLCDVSVRDPRVRPARNAGSGLVSALHTALTLARGNFLARMDADDRALPTRIAAQRAHLCNHPGIGALGTQVALFAEDAVGEGFQRYVAWQNALISAADHARERFVESPLCHPSVMFPRAAFVRVGGYREFHGPEDYDLFLRLVEAGYALAKLPQVLLHWRHRAQRATFADGRYALPCFRATKAPYLARALSAAHKARLIVWGAGPTGRRMMRELEPFGLRADAFVDIDPDKLGRVARGVSIVPATALDPERDAVLVAVGARGARELIRVQLQALGFREGVDAYFAA